MAYRFNVAKDLCKSRNLVFSPVIAQMAEQAFLNCDLSQSQANQMQKLWIDIAAWSWNPRSYKWRGRIMIALYFLGLFRSHRPK